MATMTLLDMTQNILGAMDSDSVNDVFSTTEASQVAEVIKETYFDIISSRDWPFLKTKTTLTGLGDTTNPTKMRFPTTVNKVYWIKYNKKDVVYRDPKEFQDMLDLRTEQTDVIDANGYMLNQDPVYWTSFDDDYVFFDGYDSDTESTLQASNSTLYALIIPSWVTSNMFVPTLPDKMFPLLLADAKATCFMNLKQISHAKEDRKTQRLRVRMQNEAWKNDQGESLYDSDVNYGRQSTTTFRTRPRGT